MLHSGLKQQMLRMLMLKLQLEHTRVAVGIAVGLSWSPCVQVKMSQGKWDEINY